MTLPEFDLKPLATKADAATTTKDNSAHLLPTAMKQMNYIDMDIVAPRHYRPR